MKDRGDQRLDELIGDTDNKHEAVHHENHFLKGAIRVREQRSPHGLRALVHQPEKEDWNSKEGIL